MPTTQSSYIVWGLLFTLLIQCGCGGDDLPSNYPATATVNFNGTPLTEAVIAMRPSGHEAPSVTAVTGTDGKASLFSYKGKGKGVIPGKYLVTIQKYQSHNQETSDKDFTTSQGMGIDPTSLLPQKYASFESSGFECEVTKKAENNNFVFEISN